MRNTNVLIKESGNTLGFAEYVQQLNEKKAELLTECADTEGHVHRHQRARSEASASGQRLLKEEIERHWGAVETIVKGIQEKVVTAAMAWHRLCSLRRELAGLDLEIASQESQNVKRLKQAMADAGIAEQAAWNELQRLKKLTPTTTCSKCGGVAASIPRPSMASV